VVWSRLIWELLVLCCEHGRKRGKLLFSLRASQKSQAKGGGISRRGSRWVYWGTLATDKTTAIL
jgi:hypothetical protein